MTDNLEAKDEIKRCCEGCGCEFVVAYWDVELEYYIYLEGNARCVQCREPALMQEEVA